MYKCIVPQGRIIFLLLLVFLLGSLTVGDLQAQAEKATLSGTVFDPSGAVIVGATIEARNVKTDIISTAVTDGQGHYVLPDIAVGTYDVSAEQDGFQTMMQTGIVASVGSRRVLDFTLEVGQPVDVVEVMGQASTVETQTASLSTLIAPVQMEMLPLNGRNFTDLLSLAASVATVPATGGGGGQSATAYGQSTNYSVSGSRPVGMAYMLDNTDIRNQMDHGAGVSVMGTSLGMEAIQEFTILTNTYSAEFGGSGAAVNAVTKSGTNDFHGTIYEYFRNSVLDARNYFDVASQKKPSFKRNNFGLSIGGPIKKERAFFFFNYEGLRASTGTTSRAVVPTSLPELFTAGGFAQNEETGEWEGEFGPINPVVESIFAMYPLAQSESQCPNVAGINFLPGTGLYCSQEKQIGNEDYVLGRVDIKLRDQDSMFVRYVRESAYQVLPYVYTQVPGWPEVDHERNQYLTISEQHMFSPRMINDFRFGYVRLFTETANGGINETSTVLHQVPGRDAMDFSPGWGLASLGPSPSSPSRPVMNRFSIGDNVFMALGSHSLRFGATVTRMQLNMLWNQYSGGAWIFANLGGGIFSFLGPEGGQLGGALYGAPLLGLTGAGDDYTYVTPDGESYPFNPARYWRQVYFAPFIQDDWRINNRVTLNLGLRYEWASNPVTVGEPVFTINNLTSPDTTQDDFVAVKHPFKSNPNKWNFDPRIGVAWDVFGNHKTSIRGGFGTFHEPVTSRTYANNNTSYRPNQPLFFLFWTNSLFPNLPNDPHQDIYSPLTGVTTANHEIAWYYALPNTVDKAPYMMQYNVTLQQELTAGTVLTVSYNGSRGKNLFLWSNQNPPEAFSDQSAEWQADNAASWPDATGQGPRGTVANPFVGIYTNPNFKAVEGVTPTAHSTYNGLQISLSRQFARSLVGNIAYTFSKCKDNASATNSSEQGQWAVYNAYDPDFDWGPCSYNSDHVFTANALYRLPFEGNWAMNGWQLGAIVTRYTGLPFNVQNQFGGEYQSRTGGATEGERPNLVPGCNPMSRQRDQWYNPECYVFAPYGTLGDVGRNSLNNPNFFNLDFSIVKDTKLSEEVSMQFRAEFFDFLNHPNFWFGSQAYLMGTAGVVAPTDPRYQYLSDPAAYRNPDGAICNGGQGPCYATSTGLAATMPGSQRQIQFALKFLF
jgi:hypothetical protein